MEDLLQRILLFLLGAIFVGGGLTLAFQSLEGQRAAFHAVLVGLSIVIAGLYMCIWTFVGPPG